MYGSSTARTRTARSQTPNWTLQGWETLTGRIPPK
jgi:hypothetical protein